MEAENHQKDGESWVCWLWNLIALKCQWLYDFSKGTPVFPEVPSMPTEKEASSYHIHMLMIQGTRIHTLKTMYCSFSTFPKKHVPWESLIHAVFKTSLPRGPPAPDWWQSCFTYLIYYFLLFLGCLQLCINQCKTRCEVNFSIFRNCQSIKLQGGEYIGNFASCQIMFASNCRLHPNLFKSEETFCLKLCYVWCNIPGTKQYQLDCNLTLNLLPSSECCK